MMMMVVMTVLVTLYLVWGEEFIGACASESKRHDNLLVIVGLQLAIKDFGILDTRDYNTTLIALARK